jgi:predicted AAA+ superfamily ATPase
MIEGYAAHYGLKIEQSELQRRALAWAAGRGARSGRVAWQFIQDLGGELGKSLS